MTDFSHVTIKADKEKGPFLLSSVEHKAVFISENLNLTSCCVSEMTFKASLSPDLV